MATEVGSCVPLVLFVIFSGTALLGSIGARGWMSTPAHLLIQVVITLLYGWGMYSLCKGGHTGWAWFLLLLPILLGILIVVLSVKYLRDKVPRPALDLLSTILPVQTEKNELKVENPRPTSNVVDRVRASLTRSSPIPSRPRINIDTVAEPAT